MIKPQAPKKKRSQSKKDPIKPQVRMATIENPIIVPAENLLDQPPLH